MSITDTMNSMPTVTPPQPAQNLFQKAGNFVSNIGKDAFNTLIGTPAVRIGQAGAAMIRPFLSPQHQANMDTALQQPMTIPGTGGVTVNPQKSGLAGAEQIGGQALKSAAYIVPGLGAEGIASKGIINGAIQGAKVGALSGGLGNAGQSMEEGGNIGDVANAGISGATTGALTGGAIGGASGLAGNVWAKVYGSQTPSALDTATANVNIANKTNETAGQTAFNQYKENIAGAAKDYQSDLGASFRQAPAQIEATNPGLTLNLKSDQIDALQNLKENKSFALPDYLKVGATPDGLNDIHNPYQLTPTQAQDLITQLNRSTYTDKASGLGIDQSKVGLTNEIKNAANEAFGGVKDANGKSIWGKAYGEYAQGTNALEKVTDIMNLDKDATASDMMKKIDNIKKLGESPEGKAALKSALSEFYKTTGVDLTNPVAAIHHTIDTQLASDEAQKALTQIQKEVDKGTWTERYMKALKSPEGAASRSRFLIGGALGIATVATFFRKQIGSLFSNL